MTRHLRPSIVAVLLLVAIAACSSSASKSTDAKRATQIRSNVPAYAKSGPYKVGFTTLHLPDRVVLVWYPADRAATAGKPKATYDQRTPLPDNLKGVVPDKYNAVVTMDAYADVPSAKSGPFPVLLFSHGLSAYPQVNSALTTGIASWGFVVVSADYFERGIRAQVANNTTYDADRDQRIMFAGLDLVEKENGRRGSVLEGAVDGTRVATAGHSLGGQTAFNALHDPRVKVAIGWAPVKPSKPPANKPSLIIGASGDIIFTPAALTKTYNSFAAPKRLIEIDRAGHNSFTDACPVIRRGGGLIEFARQNHLVSEQLLQLGLNGCELKNLDAATFWPVVQHFTVAELRSALGIDKQPVGLGDGIVHAFPGVTLTSTHQP